MNTEGNQSMATRVPAYRQAQLEIKRFIEVNRLGMGDPLPPEAVLAKELGISRPSLREGMKALESLGIVESRHGEGVFVAPFSFDTSSRTCRIPSSPTARAYTTCCRCGRPSNWAW